MAHLSLKLLGSFQAWLDGTPVTGFESNKVRAMLAYLAVESDQPHYRDALAGLLWPDFPDHTALSNVRYALANLRKTLRDQAAQPPFLRVTPDTLQINPEGNISLDVAEFSDYAAAHEIEDAVQAPALYRGAFLEGFSIPDSEPFEEWLRLQRERYARLMTDTLHRLAEHFELCGQYEDARRFVCRALEIEPWDEASHRHLMRVLALNGERSAALAQYESCRRALADALGVQPDEETQKLYVQVRHGRLMPRPPLPAFLRISANIPPPEQFPFVGRQDELKRLGDFLVRSLAGDGRVSFVLGEPGSGKTVLMHEFARRARFARPDLIVVSGRCNAHTGMGDPYLPFCDVLRMLSGDVEAEWAAGALSGDHARQLWSFLPSVVRSLVDSGSDLIDRFVPGAALLARAQAGAPSQAALLDGLLKRKATLPPQDRQQVDLFEQFATVCHTLARSRPLLVMIDDLQWADEGSISLLFHLGRHLAGQRILIVGAYRPGDVAAGRAGSRHPLEPVRNELRRLYGDDQVDLAYAEGRTWVNVLLDSMPNRFTERFREAFFHHTGGLPLFSVELMRGMLARGDLAQDEEGCWHEGAAVDWESLPARVEAVIAEGIERLPTPLRALATAASVQGEYFSAPVVASVQGMAEADVLGHLSGPLARQHRLVAAAGIIPVQDKTVAIYHFRHFLFQKYLYSQLDVVERARLHSATGSALEEVYGDAAPEQATQLARHFELGGMTAKAVTYLQEAGERAVRLFANAEAITCFQRALELLKNLPESSERSTQELRLRNALGVPLQALQGYTSAELEQNNERAQFLAQHMSPSPELYWLLSALGGYYLLRLMLPQAQRVAEEMLTVAERLDDLSLLLGAWQMRSLTALYQGDIEVYFRLRRQVHEHYDRKRHHALMHQFGPDVEAAGLAHEGWAYWVAGYPDKAAQQAAAAIALAEDLGQPFSRGMAHFFASVVHHWRRDTLMTRQLADATIAISQEHHLSTWLNAGVDSLGCALIAEGQLEEGLHVLEEAVEIAKAVGMDLGPNMEVTAVADGYIQLGRPTEGLALVDRGLDFVRAVGFRMIESDLYRCRGDLLLARKSEAREVEASYWKAIHSAQDTGAKSWELRAALRLCAFWTQQGRRETARELLAPLVDWFSEGFDTADLRDAHHMLVLLEH